MHKFSAEIEFKMIKRIKEFFAAVFTAKSKILGHLRPELARVNIDSDLCVRAAGISPSLKQQLHKSGLELPFYVNGKFRVLYHSQA